MHQLGTNCSLLQDGRSFFNLSSTTRPDLQSPDHDSHLHAVYMVGFPTFIAVGILANIIDLWVLSQPSMQGIAFRYLARLAASDLLYLLFNIPFCLEEFALTSDGLPVTESAAIYYAYIAVPVVNFFLTLSVYIVVWLSYDRWLAVCYPHKFSSQQTLVVVYRRCIATFLVTFAIYVPCPLRQTYSCYASSGDIPACCIYESEYMNQKWYYFYEFGREVYSRFLPGILITAFNMAIIWTLRLAKRNKNCRPTSQVVQDFQRRRPIEAIFGRSKRQDDSGQTAICIGLHHLSLSCCDNAASSPVLLAKLEQESVQWKRASDTGKQEKEVNNIEDEKRAAIDVDGQEKEATSVDSQERDVGITHSSQSSFGKFSEHHRQDRIVRHCSVIPIRPLRTSLHSNQSKTSKKQRGSYIIVNENRNDREVCLVFLLLAITVFFYISSFPSALYKIIPLNDDKQHKQPVNTFRAVADVLEVSGHVFNFFLYFLLSPEFRKTLLLLIPRLSCQDA
ncbi:uncharacterized protein LOC108669405 [Hyalella azteca]|uniref:Uncharacterized protein LOC108669405 n=1 Tax=Hyalella azteca TaxID=294128 RepID=A0A8B7NF23_HYAAZ|nr:uncharacterized protein LOC108669405 [Hyalella azteca]XP_018012218.1 uncharacterized protein LOC108669405 [Hyalella azteca]XP_047735532.1 uncharacterized protein LOC108669405 [Hyalella azteca]